MLYLTIGIYALAVAILAYVGYRLGFPQAYVNYWVKASTATPDGAVGISAKRAVFIHGAAAGFVTVFIVLAKAGWVFTKESLDAFNTVVYCAAGGYVGGKVAEWAAARFAPKQQDPNTGANP